MKRFLFLMLVIGLVPTMLVGCASIVSKSKYPVLVSSEPVGANIIIKNSRGETVFTGETPASVTLKAGAGYFKGENYTVLFKKQGFVDNTANIKRGLDSWYVFGNLMFGSTIGWLIVDPLTGAMWTLKDLNVSLVPQASAENTGSIKIVTLDSIPDNLRSEMVRIN